MTSSLSMSVFSVLNLWAKFNPLDEMLIVEAW